MLTAHTKCLPAFIEELNSLTARALNALRGISGTNIEKGYGLVEPQDAEKLLEHAVYTLTNPCKSDLVTKARHWQGVTTMGMRYGQEIVLRKPRYGLWAPKATNKVVKRKRRKDTRTPSKRGRSCIPESVTLRLVRPPVRTELSDDELRDLVFKRVEARESVLEATRAQLGRKVLKMRNVKKQHWATMPGAEDLFGARPSVSAKDKWKRISALQRKKDFERAYMMARKRWLGGEKDVEFPWGTWLMCHRYSAACAGYS